MGENGLFLLFSANAKSRRPSQNARKPAEIQKKKKLISIFRLMQIRV
jgi:hypothetical protein